MTEGAQPSPGSLPETFTRQHLSRFDGSRGRSYVAIDGAVYDVSSSAEWRGGLHRELHWAGQDLSAFLPPEFERDDSYAYGIWRDASFIYVAGDAYNNDSGLYEALLWTSPIPEPGTAAIFSLGGLLVATTRRNRTRYQAGFLGRRSRLI